MTYTVTFSEDMDSGTVAADDFDNEGSAAVTIGTVTEGQPALRRLHRFRPRQRALEPSSYG